MKPTEKLFWALDPSALVADPPSAKKDTGWNHLERPDPRHWNKMWKILSEWISWLDHIPAADIPIVDSGSLFASGNVEGALQEAMAALNSKSASSFTTGTKIPMNQATPPTGWVIDTANNLSQHLLITGTALEIQETGRVGVGHSHSTAPKDISFVIGTDLFRPQGRVTPTDPYIAVQANTSGLSTPYGRIQFFSSVNWKRRTGTQVPNLSSVISSLSLANIKKVFYIVARKT
jgi:hypothetical protein